MDIMQYRDNQRYQRSRSRGEDTVDDPTLEELVLSMGKHLLSSNSSTITNGLTTNLQNTANHSKIQKSSLYLNHGNRSIHMNETVLQDSYIGNEDAENDEVSQLTSHSQHKEIDISQEYPRLTTPFYEQLRTKYPNAFKRRESRDEKSLRPTSSLGLATRRRLDDDVDDTAPLPRQRPSSVLGGKLSTDVRNEIRNKSQELRIKSFEKFRQQRPSSVIGIPVSGDGDTFNRPPSRTEKLLAKLKSKEDRSQLIGELMKRPNSRQSNKFAAENGDSIESSKQSQSSLKERMRKNQQSLNLLLQDDSSPVQLKKSKRKSSGKDKDKKYASSENLSVKGTAIGKQIMQQTEICRDSRLLFREGASKRLLSPDSHDSAMDVSISSNYSSPSDSQNHNVNVNKSKASAKDTTQSEKIARKQGLSYSDLTSQRDSDVDSGIVQYHQKDINDRKNSLSSIENDSETCPSKAKASPSCQPHLKLHHKSPSLTHQKSGPLKADHNIQLVLTPRQENNPQCKLNDETASVKSSLKSGKSCRSSSPNRVRFKDDVDDTDPRLSTSDQDDRSKSSVLNLLYAKPLLNGRITPPPSSGGRKSPLIEFTHDHSNHERTKSIEQEFFQKLRSQSPIIMTGKATSKIPISVKHKYQTSSDQSQLEDSNERQSSQISSIKQPSPHAVTDICKNEQNTEAASTSMASNKPANTSSTAKLRCIFGKHKGSYNPSKIEEHVIDIEKFSNRKLSDKPSRSPESEKSGIPVMKKDKKVAKSYTVMDLNQKRHNSTVKSEPNPDQNLDKVMKPKYASNMNKSNKNSQSKALLGTKHFRSKLTESTIEQQQGDDKNAYEIVDVVNNVISDHVEKPRSKQRPVSQHNKTQTIGQKGKPNLSQVDSGQTSSGNLNNTGVKNAGKRSRIICIPARKDCDQAKDLFAPDSRDGSLLGAAQMFGSMENVEDIQPYSKVSRASDIAVDVNDDSTEINPYATISYENNSTNSGDAEKLENSIESNSYENDEASSTNLTNENVHQNSIEDEDINPYATVQYKNSRLSSQRPRASSVPPNYERTIQHVDEQHRYVLSNGDIYATVDNKKKTSYHSQEDVIGSGSVSSNPCVVTDFDDSITVLDSASPEIPRRKYKSSSTSNLAASKELSASRTSLKEKVDSFKKSAKEKFSTLKRAISLDRIDRNGKDKNDSITSPKIKKSPSLRSLKLSFKKKEDRSSKYAPDGFLHDAPGAKERKLKRSTSSASRASLASVEDVEPPRNFRAIGKLLMLNPDGTQLIELVKPPHGPFGFYIARGNALYNHGIFVSRLSDGHPEKFFAGLLGLGDEILEINGLPVKDLSLDDVYDNMAVTNRLVLKTLPLLARNDMV